MLRVRLAGDGYLMLGIYYTHLLLKHNGNSAVIQNVVVIIMDKTLKLETQLKTAGYIFVLFSGVLI